SAKARYYSAKREDKEHVCDYLNRLSGYTRNAGVQFENGGREAKDHVEHFLDMCDDSGLEERLCHVRVKDVHDLEDMINDILKRRDRKSKRDSSVRRSGGQDGGRRRDGGRNEDSRNNYRRDDRRRDESPYRPSITLAEALSDLVTALNETSVGSQTSQQTPYDQEYELNEDSFGDGERRDDEDRFSNRGSEYDYAGEDERSHVAAANNHERRAAAEGTFARSDNRRSKGDGHFNNDRGFARDSRNGRQQYGPCAACGGLTHSVHYCYKRCKMCKQVHDAGKCQAFSELASLLRSKVDKNDLTPMLQSVLAEPAVDADYLFAFAGEVKWPEDREIGFVNTTGIVEENGGNLGENEVGEVDTGEYDGLPDEVTVPLVKSANTVDDEPYGAQAVGGPTEDLYIPRGVWREFRLPQKRPAKPVWVRLTNVSDRTARCYKHSSVLAYAEGRDNTRLRKEKELYEYWLAEQPPAVEQQEYTTPERILTRPTKGSVAPNESSRDLLGSDDGGDDMNSYCCMRTRDESEASVAVGMKEEAGEEPYTHPTEFSDVGDDEKDPAEDSVDMLELTYISVMNEIEAEIAAGNQDTDEDWYEHIPNEMELADYAHELAFLNLALVDSTRLHWTECRERKVERG
ncbi:hypothetical protein PHMEG_00028015, partial [Phytophthora megakarya]